MKKIVLLLFYFTFCIAFSSFCQGIWTTRASFSGATRWAAVGFSIGTKGYVVTGSNNSNDFWEWDQPTNTWSQKANFPGTTRELATGFSIGTKGYAGTGLSGSNVQDFWQYDQPTNTWAQKASIGGVGRQWAASFSIGAKGYVGGGYDAGYLQDFWQYDQATDTWSQKANFGGGARGGGVGFAIGNKGYMGLGCNNANYPTGYKDLWEYDTLANTWIQKANFPGSGRIEAVAFTIGLYGYVGAGTTLISSGDTTDFWRFDPTSNTWSQTANYGGGLIEEVASFSIGCFAYVVTGFVNDGFSYNQDLWQFYDSSNTTCSACQLVANFQSSDTVFCSEPGQCIDFTDLSTCNPTSWQWHFTGASTDTSSQQNPSGICYYTPGTYAVTLIVSNGTSTDTIAVPAMIIVGGVLNTPVITVLGGDTLKSSSASAYQWFLNGIAIAGATDSFYVAHSGGTYSVMAINYGCTSLSNGVLITATDEMNSVVELNVYPNPTRNQLTVSSWQLANEQVAIEFFNVLGEKVYCGVQTANCKLPTVIDVSFLHKGIYIMSITLGVRVYRTKFAKD